MTPHPTPEELEGLLRGTLTRGTAKAVVRHLLAGCPACQSIVARSVTGLLGKRTAPASDGLVEHALAASLIQAQQIGRQKAKIREALERLSEGGVERFRDFPLELWGRAAYDVLLERSWALRFQDPQQMVTLARLTTLAASRLADTGIRGRQQTDLEFRAAVELANAYRVANRFDEARHALERAASLFLDETTDSHIRARYHLVLGAILGDLRQFGAAFRALGQARRISIELGDDRLTSKVLVSQGLYAGYAHRTERAIAFTKRALACPTAHQDPELGRAAGLNIVVFSFNGGRLREARETLEICRPALVAAERFETLRLRWLEARLQAAAEEFEDAEKELLAVREGFREARLLYDLAALSLELGGIALSRGKELLALRYALDSAQHLRELGVGRRTLSYLVSTRAPYKFELASRALLDLVTPMILGHPPGPSAPPSSAPGL